MKILKTDRTFDSLKLRDFRLLWMSQLSGSLSMWMDQTARSWLVYSLTGSAFDLGLVNALRGAPMLIFGVIAGALADRYSRKMQMATALVLTGLLNAVLATLIITNTVEVWHIYLTSILAGIVHAFQMPSGQALVNDLVGKEKLLNAISLNAAANNVSRIVGPAICGVIIGVLGIDMAYYIQGGLFAISTVMILQVRVPEAATRAMREMKRAQISFFSGTREGLSYITKHRVIFSLIILALAPMILGSPYLSMVPIFAVDIFGGDANTQGIILMTGGVGAVIGALIVASFSRRQGSIPILIGAASGYGLAIVGFAVSPVLWMALSATFISSACMALYQAQNQTIIQMITPNYIQGRVLGVYMLSFAFTPQGSLLMGALSGALGAPMGVALMGGACFLVAVVVAIFSRSLWKLNLDAERDKAASMEAEHANR